MKISLAKNGPDFFVVGSAKSGTTSLWHYLSQHPDIYVNSNPKELGYFSEFYGISKYSEYLSYFDEAKDNQTIGEVCHAYLTCKNASQRIFEYNKNSKIIIILRNPITRAQSLYDWMVYHGFEPSRTFHQAFVKEKQRSKNYIELNNIFYYQNFLYANSGLYYNQVKRYYNLFPAERIKIYLYEDFFKPHCKIQDLFNFLEVNPNFQVLDDKPKNVSPFIKNPKYYYYMKNSFINNCDSFYIPRRLAYKLRNLLLKKLVTMQARRPLGDKLEKELKLFFRDDVLKLSDLTGINFKDSWGF